MKNFNYKKYWNHGMGLHEDQLRTLHEVIMQNEIRNIVDLDQENQPSFF